MDDKMQHGDAADYCADLQLGDRSDWRLPSAKELHSIVDHSRSPDPTGSAAIAPLFEAGVIENELGQDDFGSYWTSTTQVPSAVPPRPAPARTAPSSETVPRATRAGSSTWCAASADPDEEDGAH